MIRDRSRASKGAPTQTGFTLLEMMVVLVIMSLTAAFVVPQLAGSLTKMNAGTAARKIAASLRHARSKAVTERIPYFADFDPRLNRLAVRKYLPAEEGKTSPEDVYYKIYDLPDGLRLDTEQESFPLRVRRQDGEKKYTIVFYPTGASSGGGITVRDEDRRSYRVIVDMITGSVRLTE